MAARILTFALVIWLASGFSAAARADLLIIVNSSNPIEKLERKQVIDLFMGRVTAFPNQRPARTLDLRESNPLRATFYKTLTGKSEAQVDAYWATLIFAGRMSPPEKFMDEASIINAVKTNTSAIAYVTRQNLPENVKVVMELPTEQ